MSAFRLRKPFHILLQIALIFAIHFLLEQLLLEHLYLVCCSFIIVACSWNQQIADCSISETTFMPHMEHPSVVLNGGSELNIRIYGKDT